MDARRALVRGVMALAILVAAASISSAAPLWSAPLVSPSPSLSPLTAGPALAPTSESAESERVASAATIDVETLGAPLAARPAQPAMAARILTAPIGDHCLDRDLAAPPAMDAVYTLLDRSYALPADYVPRDLVSVGEAGFAGSELLRAIVLPDLAALGEATAAAGLSLIVESGYRSYEAQAATFAYWTGVEGSAAVLRAARPGHSEHQLGTAIDVTSPGWSGRVGDWGAESAEGAWMEEHAWEFGFVMSYPPGGDGTSCFGYEPWHFRWTGRDVAAAHRASSEPLRLFLVRYLAG